jgi:hypothetical protein
MWVIESLTGGLPRFCRVKGLIATSKTHGCNHEHPAGNQRCAFMIGCATAKAIQFVIPELGRQPFCSCEGDPASQSHARCGYNALAYRRIARESQVVSVGEHIISRAILESKKETIPPSRIYGTERNLSHRPDIPMYG